MYVNYYLYILLSDITTTYTKNTLSNPVVGPTYKLYLDEISITLL